MSSDVLAESPRLFMGHVVHVGVHPGYMASELLQSMHRVGL